MYETDIRKLSTAIHRHNNFYNNFNTPSQIPIICNISSQVNTKLYKEFHCATQSTKSMWFTPEAEEYKQDLIMRALFPTENENPWTNLPVLPRTQERAEAEAKSFPKAMLIHTSKDTTFNRHVPPPRVRHTHDAIRARLLRKHRELGHPSKRIMQHIISQSDSKSERDLSAKVRKFMPQCIWQTQTKTTSEKVHRLHESHTFRTTICSRL